MGGIIQAECDCGFYIGSMQLGGGMMNHETSCSFPNYCKDCKEFFIANMYDESIICDSCHSQNTVPYDHKDVIKEMDGMRFLGIHQA